MNTPARWWRQLGWLVSFQGRVARRPYLVAGAVLAAIKLVLDYALAVHLAGQPWTPWRYWVQPPLAELRGLPQGHFASALIAVLFAWFGVALTVRRLRDAGVPAIVTLLFVVPVVNLVMIAKAAILPTRPANPAAERDAPTASASEAAGASLWWWASVGAVVATLLAALGTWIEVYGESVFLGVPYLQGFLIGFGTRRQSVAASCAAVGTSVLLLAAGLLAFAFEGILCLMMAAPIWLGMALLGMALGRVYGRLGHASVAVVLVAVPTLQLCEPALLPNASVFEVATEVVVKAKPTVVWRNLVAFSELPPPDELWFRLGIAHPLRATIEGSGVGAVRRCTFTTGDFVEPIEVWDEPRLLRFRVQECPQPMVEWNPWHDHIDAPHLHGTFVSWRGQFALHELPDGSTSLVGTTWYSHGMWPEAYWALWSETILHTIHRRVLEHIRHQAERDARGG